MVDVAWRTEHLAWDSDFWGCRVGRVRCEADAATLEGLDAALDELDFAYLLCEADAAAQLGVAEQLGFRIVDVRCELGATLDAPPPRAAVAIRRAHDDELPAVADLASTLHRNTRFANDRQLDQARVAELYRTWIHRDSKRPGWQVSVLADDASVAGYVTHGPETENDASIGLIGVAPWRQGRGAGRALLDAALSIERAGGRTSLHTVTQGGSTGSLRMYQSAGFHVRRLHIWLHWHRR